MPDSKRFKRRWSFLIGLLLLTTTGCVTESVVDGEHVFTYEMWIPIAVLLGGIAAIPLGLVLRRVTARIGWALVFLGPIAAIVLAPSMLMDRVTVSSKGLHVRTGIWGMTAVHDVQWDKLTMMRITVETSSRRGSESNSFFINCDEKDGKSVKIPDNAVVDAAAEQIFTQARAHKIEIIDQTGGKLQRQ